MSDTNCVSAAVLVWENKMAVDQKFLKPNLDDVSGHVTNKTYFYFQLTKLFTLAQWQDKKVNYLSWIKYKIFE